MHPAISGNGIQCYKCIQENRDFDEIIRHFNLKNTVDKLRKECINMNVKTELRDNHALLVQQNQNR